MLSVRCLSSPACLSLCLPVTLVYCGQTVRWIKMNLGTVSWGPSPTKGHPEFSAYACFGQTVGWIKTPLGTEESLVPGYIILNANPAPPRKMAHYCGQVK